MPTAVRLDPHPVSSRLLLETSEFWDPMQEDLKVDAERVPSDDDDGVGTTIYLTNLEWRQLRAQLEAQLPTVELERVLPNTSSWKEDVLLLVSIQCAASKLRRVARLEPTARGRWRGDLLIRRDEVRDSVRLVARLVRGTEIVGEQGEGKRYATYQAAVIAEAPVVTLIFDERRRREGLLRIRWEDFRKSPNPWRSKHPSDVFHLDPQGERPTLWLNARYEKLRAALKSRVVRGEDAVIRHLVNAILAQTVWTQLFVVALAGTETGDDEGSVDEPREPWKQAVLRKLLPRVFPDSAHYDRLDQAVTQLRSPELAGNLVSRVGTAVQDAVGTDTLIEKAIRAAEARGGTA
jgi:hypothetical protein